MIDIYQIVTDRIIAELEKGVIPWKKPWRGSEAINYVTRKPYRGINTLLLPHGGEYLSFKQCKEQGGSVRKGERSHMIVFFKMIDRVDAETGEVESFPYIRYSNVFHLSQCEGIKSKLDPIDVDAAIEPIQAAQSIFDDYAKRSGVKVKHVEGGHKAYYVPSSDAITLPKMNQFMGAAEYYSTAFHEAAHSTGHISRLNRLDKLAAFGSETYSKEELVAEISAAMVMNAAGIEQTGTFENSASYINAWLKKLKNDKRLIVAASSAAQKASDLILNMAS